MDKGVLTAGLATVFIGFNIVIASVASKVIHPFVLITIGYLLSIIFLFGLSKLIREKIEIRKLFSNYKKELFSITISRAVIGTILLITGFSLVPAIRAVFLVRLEPIFVFIISIFLLKEQPKIRKIFLLLVLLFGAIIFTTNGSLNIFSEITTGDLLIIGALIFLAYSYIPSSKLSKNINSNTITIGSNLISAMIFLPLMFLVVPNISIDYNSFYLILAYTITFYVLGLFLWFRALKQTNPWIISSVLSLESVSGALLAFLWLGQTLSTVQFIGAAIMIVTTFFISKQQPV